MKKSIFKKTLKIISIILVLILVCSTIYLVNFITKLKKYNPSEGGKYYWPYYVYISNGVKQKLEKGENVNILVLPNNSMGVSDNMSRHEMYSIFHALVGHIMFGDLNTIILVPIFPRPQKEFLIYTHALDRDVMVTDIKELQRLDLQLIAMIDEVRGRNEKWKINKKVLMWGFSASGMFTNRFTLLHPDRVLASVVGSPGGWPIAPVKEWQGKLLRYPIGIGDFYKITGAQFDLDTYKNVPQFLFLGENDTNDSVPYDDSYDNEDEKLINKLFGYEPIKRWEYAEKIYKEVEIDAKFKVYKGVGHRPTLKSFKEAKEFFIKNMN
ncbi:alpha/beta hydrolase family protein [Brassicibacter mesophilus]|uniref:alpha/beta hydrolase family protein n=1 Tax=Brassicibacter mesophilus TaxID=745119 RepID=UPI003D1A1D66